MTDTKQRERGNTLDTREEKEKEDKSEREKEKHNIDSNSNSNEHYRVISYYWHSSFIRNYL